MGFQYLRRNRRLTGPIRSVIVNAPAIVMLGCSANSITTLKFQHPVMLANPNTEAGTGGGQNPKGAGASDKTHPLVSITPFSDAQLDYAPADGIPQSQLPGTYTRLLITSVTASPQGSSQPAPYYRYKPRNFIRRWLWGEHTSTNLTAKIAIGSFQATVPLATIDHVSTKTEGENFSRVVYHQVENYPLFLVKSDGSNGIVSVKSAVKMNSQVQSGLAGAALEVAQGVAREVAPQSAVLTTLTAQSSKNVATAIDSAVNKLFASTLDEEQWSDSDIRFWQKGVTITFRIPKKEGHVDGRGHLEDWTDTVGTWTVKFANARPSIFSDIEVCPTSPDNSAAAVETLRCRPSYAEAAKAVEQAVQPSDVLTFNLSNSTAGIGTVGAYIKQQSWYLTAVKAFAGAPTAPQAADFCRSIKSSMASLDLNAIDQSIIAFAQASVMEVSGGDAQLLSKQPDCQMFNGAYPPAAAQPLPGGTVAAPAAPPAAPVHPTKPHLTDTPPA
jgi:hypothetical protein